jgi:hypothetical protein
MKIIEDKEQSLDELVIRARQDSFLRKLVLNASKYELQASRNFVIPNAFDVALSEDHNWLACVFDLDGTSGLEIHSIESKRRLASKFHFLGCQTVALHPDFGNNGKLLIANNDVIGIYCYNKGKFKGLEYSADFNIVDLEIDRTGMCYMIDKKKEYLCTFDNLFEGYGPVTNTMFSEEVISIAKSGLLSCNGCQTYVASNRSISNFTATVTLDADCIDISHNLRDLVAVTCSDGTLRIFEGEYLNLLMEEEIPGVRAVDFRGDTLVAACDEMVFEYKIVEKK